MRSPTDQTDRTRALRRWLVLAAWPPELAEFRRLIGRKRTGRQVVARTAGVGLVEAAIGAATAIADVKPEAVMFVGTAGLYPDRRPDLALAGAVAARRLVLMADGVASHHAYLPPAMRTRRRAATAPARARSGRRSG